MGKILKLCFWIAAYLFLFVNIFLINMLLHETGHYIVADYYGLDPDIEFNFGEINKLNLGFKGVGIASTSFIDNGDTGQMRVIALMGPFMNLFLGLIMLSVFVFFRKFGFLAEISMMGVIISFGAFLTNMLPFQGVDGGFVFGLW